FSPAASVSPNAAVAMSASHFACPRMHSSRQLIVLVANCGVPAESGGTRFAHSLCMLDRMRIALLAVLIFLGTATCSPYLPPTTVPQSPDPSLEPFKAALQAYVDQTQPYRKQAAQA